MPNVTPKIHFLRLSEIWYYIHLSRINLRPPMWSLRKLNTVHSSKYTSKNVWIYSLKDATVTLEKIEEAFFKPNGMTVY